MLVSKEVKVKSSKYYSNLGYDINDRYIYVKIEDVPLGSRAIIVAKCDYCGKEKEISYKDYNANIINCNKFSCSIKCGMLKVKENNTKKWGVEYYFQSEDFKDKSKKTLLNNWGVDHISKSKSINDKIRYKMKLKSDEISERIKNFYSTLSEEDINLINEKRKNTNLERYGVENISQNESIKEKVKKTSLDRWGGFTMQSEELRKKVKATNLKKYNTEYTIQSDIVKEKTKQTNLERYGYESALKNDTIREKIKNTLLERYGVNNPMKLDYVVNKLREKFKEKWNTDTYFNTEEFKISNKGKLLSDDDWRKENLLIADNQYYIKYLGDNISLFKCDNDKDHTFSISSSNYYNRVSKLCTECYPITSGSNKQKELYNFISSIYNDNIIENWRKLNSYEIDIFLPNLKIGFEFNGLYWHSESRLGKNYHRDKLEFFQKNDIRVFNIWEDDWDYKKDIVKSQIRNWLKISSNKIWARKCQIKEITDSKIPKLFLDENHIQGYIRSVIKIGLFYNDDLVALMTFDNIEGRKKMETDAWNLSRFCNKLNTNVIGGASKLLSYFIKKYNPVRIISYADMDWSKGNLYEKLGFSLKSELSPDYQYVINGKRVNKRKFSKSNLSKIKNIDLSLSESNITKQINIERIYNCGKLKYEYLN
jgi:hypothetical protein